MTQSITRRQALQGMAAVGAASLAPAALASPSALLIAGEAVELTLTPITPRTLRITLQRLTGGTPESLVEDGALALPSSARVPVRLRALDQAQTLSCGELKVTLSPSPLTIRIEHSDGRLVQQLTLDSGWGELLFHLGNAPLLGLGQGGPQFDRRGSYDRMLSGQAGYQLGTHGARVPARLFRSPRPTGSSRAPATVPALPLDVFVLGETDPAALLASYAAITGLAEMPPLWSLGYQQSYRTLGTPEEILQEAKTFRDKQLPCDTLIYLGTGFCPEGWNVANGDFTWNAHKDTRTGSCRQHPSGRCNCESGRESDRASSSSSWQGERRHSSVQHRTCGKGHGQRHGSSARYGYRDGDQLSTHRHR